MRQIRTQADAARPRARIPAVLADRLRQLARKTLLPRCFRARSPPHNDCAQKIRDTHQMSRAPPSRSRSSAALSRSRSWVLYLLVMMTVSLVVDCFFCARGTGPSITALSCAVSARALFRGRNRTPKQGPRRMRCIQSAPSRAQSAPSRAAPTRSRAQGAATRLSAPGTGHFGERRVRVARGVGAGRWAE